MTSITPQELDDINKYVYTQLIKIPTSKDKVYKDECIYSLDTPFMPNGLFTNLKTWQSVGKDYLDYDHIQTNNSIYLHQKWNRIKKETTSNYDSNNDMMPTKLAIGVKGGFDPDTYKIEKENTLIYYKNKILKIINKENYSSHLENIINAIIFHTGMQTQQEIASWSDKRRIISKYAANLIQINRKNISSHSNDWICENPECKNKKTNLWLNLSDGFIGCGRPNWDGTGGCGAALSHYESTNRKFPLAVKLGTITPDGIADVYSYANDENDMVNDPYLNEHLLFFGINMKNQIKNEKTMDELQVSLNLNYQFNDSILESDKKLVQVYGKELLGLHNLGNTCYMNSVLQIIIRLDEIRSKYYNIDNFVAMNQNDNNLIENFNVQFAKICNCLLSERYVIPNIANNDNIVKNDEILTGIHQLKPSIFRHLIGKNHVDFSTSQQQDAGEFFLYLIEMIDNNLKEKEPSFLDFFHFRLKQRFQCLESNKVKYITSKDTMLQLPIPVTNIDEKDGEKNSIRFEECLENYFSDEIINDFYSTAVEKNVTAKKNNFFYFNNHNNKYLVIQLCRYVLNDDWTTRKLQVKVEVPEKINIKKYIYNPLSKETEAFLPEENETSHKDIDLIQIDELLLEQLICMGFSENIARKGLYKSYNNFENAMEWILNHPNDTDLDEIRCNKLDDFDKEMIQSLCNMGFTKEQSECAIHYTSNCTNDQKLDAAANWLFSNIESSDVMVLNYLEEKKNNETSANKEENMNDDNYIETDGNYSLISFISHIGKNTHSGHYVCHIKDNQNRWLLFNDEKIAISENPPFNLGYIYFFKKE